MSNLDKVPGWCFAIMVLGIIGMAIFNYGDPMFTAASIIACTMMGVITGALFYGASEEEDEEPAE